MVGNVTDSQKGAVTEATVTLTETATGAGPSVKTNGEGLYTIPYLSPGRYRVQVEVAGVASRADFEFIPLDILWTPLEAATTR